MKRYRIKAIVRSSQKTTTYAVFRVTVRFGIKNGNVCYMPPSPVAIPVIVPRCSGPPRPVTLPSSDRASESPMLIAAPSDAASPTKNALRGRSVRPAAAKGRERRDGAVHQPEERWLNRLKNEVPMSPIVGHRRVRGRDLFSHADVPFARAIDPARSPRVTAGNARHGAGGCLPPAQVPTSERSQRNGFVVNHHA
jgi:hypothetical protein